MSHDSGPGSDETTPRYVVGIDLGTTNCAVGFVDTERDPWQVETFLIPQWVDVDQWERRETLPSFHYQWTEAEQSTRQGRLPWEGNADRERACVGVYARDAGQRHPGRRAASAKSWLSHDGVDRTADLLPWHGDAEVERLSPVEASAAYLKHLRQAWDEAHAEHPLADQDLVITLPASFDEVARELTVAAAKAAGLPRVYLIEEPQAAFYAWINKQGDAWPQHVAAGQLILVCDIGGGTTDLTLIRVRATQGGDVQFHRVAVGKHLILGGDNLDLAIAKLAESKWQAGHEGAELTAGQWQRLTQAARDVKETMLGGERPDAMTINLPAEGSRLVGGAIQIELTAAEVDAVILEGFFPEVALTDRPHRGQSGFQEFGLPYAADPAVTRHLASFLATHRHRGAEDDDGAATRPVHVLFNGGVMRSSAIAERIVQVIGGWFAEPDEATWQPNVLSGTRLDLAVAQGAAYYGMVRRGEGVRIAANLGRSYYLQVSAHPARGLCLIPGSAEAGQRFTADQHPLHLQTGTPVQFPLWVSSTRLADAPGSLVELQAGEATPLPPICTALVRGRKREAERLDVVLEAELSEIGTVGIFCADTKSSKRWKLEFDIRSTLETDRTAHEGGAETAGIVDAESQQQCAVLIEQTFGPAPSLKPNRLVKSLQGVLETSKANWPPTLLREIWQVLLEHEAGRRHSPAHELRWLNLLGYSLRPGYGIAVDDWRVSETWRMVHNKLVHASAGSRIEATILWRRISGGLTTAQQTQLAMPLLSSLRGKGGRVEANEAIEQWRLLGSLERLATPVKQELGELALRMSHQRKHEKLHEALYWSLGRLASRQPSYGPLNTTIPSSVVAGWVEELAKRPAGATTLPICLVQAARRVGDRFRDLPEAARESAATWLRAANAPQHYVAMIEEGGQWDRDDQAAVFGESLPLGIHLRQ